MLICGPVPKAVRDQIWAHGLDRWTASRNRQAVFIGDRFAPKLLGRAALKTDRKLENDRGIGSEAAQDAGDGAVQAGDDGADADNGSGADDHAQNGKERAHFVLAHSVERQADAELSSTRVIGFPD